MALKQKCKKLTEKETQIMRLLWENGSMFVREMLEHYECPRPHFNTVSTTVRILEDKGFVAHEPVLVSPLLRFGTTIRLPRTLPCRSCEKFFNNSYASAVSALAEEEKISVDELRNIIAMVEEKNKKD